MMSLSNAPVENKTILLRLDYNVPIKNNVVIDDERIRASIPTLNYLLSKKCKIIITSHLGRPNGEVVNELRLNPVANKLSELMKLKVSKLDESTWVNVTNFVQKMHPKDIVILENIQFDPREKQNNDSLAKELASLAQIFVLDAFGQVHRNYASLTKIQNYLPSYAGFLLEKEVKVLSSLLENPKKPFIAILGGSKVSDKIALIKNLLNIADYVLIGGAMAFTLLKIKGYEVGKTKIEEFHDELLASDPRIILPVDAVLADKFDENSTLHIDSVDKISGDKMALDVGPKTVELFKSFTKSAKTVVWNGPLGVFEWDSFANGTLDLARSMAQSDAITVIGGGDTLAAAAKAKVAGKFFHTSTGGGAMLEFLEGKKLPGIVALDNNSLAKQE